MIDMVATPRIIFGITNDLSSEWVIMDVIYALNDISIIFNDIAFESSLPDIAGIGVFLAEFLTIG